MCDKGLNGNVRKPDKTASEAAGSDDLLPEYRFDYRKARPNRFAGNWSQDCRMVLLDPDIAKVFRTAESVNSALRSLVCSLRRKPNRKVASRA